MLSFLALSVALGQEPPADTSSDVGEMVVNPSNGESYPVVPSGVLTFLKTASPTYPAEAAADASVPDVVDCKAMLFVESDTTVSEVLAIDCPEVFRPLAGEALSLYELKGKEEGRVATEVVVRFDRNASAGITREHPLTGEILLELEERDVKVKKKRVMYGFDESCFVWVFVTAEGTVDHVDFQSECRRQKVVDKKLRKWTFSPQLVDGEAVPFAMEYEFFID